MRVLPRRGRRTRHLELEPFVPEDLAGLTTLIDHHLEQPFPGWTAGMTLVQRLATRPETLLPPDRARHLRNWCLLCARVGGQVVGALQMCRQPPSSSGGAGTAHIVWLLCGREDPATGEALLRRAKTRARAWRCRQIRAFQLGLGGLAGLGSGGLPAAWGHIERLLERAHFGPVGEHVVWAGVAPPVAELPAGVVFHVAARPPGWTAEARCGARVVGTCRVRAALREASSGRGSAAVVEWVEVAEAWRRQGIGSALVSTAVRAAAAHGHGLVAAAPTSGDVAFTGLARSLGWAVADRLRVYGYDSGTLWRVRPAAVRYPTPDSMADTG